MQGLLCREKFGKVSKRRIIMEVSILLSSLY